MIMKDKPLLLLWLTFRAEIRRDPPQILTNKDNGTKLNISLK